MDRVELSPDVQRHAKFYGQTENMQSVGPDYFHSGGKRAFDTLFGGLISLGMTPLVLALSIQVLKTDGWPAEIDSGEFDHNLGVFVHARKLRTMVRNAPDLKHLQTKKMNGEADPRIIPKLAWMRRWSLDEIPQLKDVFLGNATLVGPRWIRPVEFEEIHSRKPELVVALIGAYEGNFKPGITGPYAVWYRGGQLINRAEADYQYSKLCNSRTDLKFLALTPLAILSGKGAQ